MKLKQKSALFDERLADKLVIDNLIKELARSKSMSKILQDENGVLYLAHNFEKLVAEDVSELLNTLKEDVKLLENSEADESGAATVSAPADDVAPPAPADPAPADSPIPPTPAPADVPLVSAPPAPADQAAAPAVDPNAPAPANPGSVTLQ